MKIINLSILSSLILLSACKMNTIKTVENKQIGGQKDKHGCLTSAGYSWSYIKEKCIRPFEDGIALLEVSPTASFQVATYLLFDENKKKAEIFVPNTSTSIILNQQNKQEYKNGKYRLQQVNTCWILFIDNKKKFEEN